MCDNLILMKYLENLKNVLINFPWENYWVIKEYNFEKENDVNC